ncbi:MAG: metalloregulator ArsR/SmtB family transcription factor [Planctomycetes bacterium]|nr:metalloregulator ArsR/SmtB family transcription factor [Planctomycetota bacterium]
MQKFTRITKAISDENRVRALMLLRGGEICLCQIIEVLGFASSTVSKHMSILVQAGLVRVRKEGRWRYFSLPNKNAPSQVLSCLKWIEESLSKDKTTARDAKKLDMVLKIPVEEICGSCKPGKNR